MRHGLSFANLSGAMLIPSRVVERRVARLQRMGTSSTPFIKSLASLSRFRLAKQWGLFIHPTAIVGRVSFPHPTGIVIGAGVLLEDDVTCYQQVTLGAIRIGGADYPTVRRGAVLFAGATVLGGVEIGERAVVGANSLVLADVPPGVVVAGTPARIVRSVGQGVSNGGGTTDRK